jgi:hypothetical protein
MKKITLLLFFIYQVTSAQITYNSSDFATLTDSYYMSSATALLTADFTTAGANVSWDYSTLTPVNQEQISWVNPNNTGYKTTWCFLNGYLFNCNSQFNANFNLANIVTEGLSLPDYGLTNVYMHSNVSSASYSNKMIGVTISTGTQVLPLTVDYTAPDIVYQFPINYNDNYTNTSALSIDLTALGVPVALTTSGIRTNVVEGWGSLITPFGTFANTLKMKTTLVETTSITSNGTTTDIPRTTITYKWFDTNYGTPVLEVSGDVLATQWIPTSVRYIDIQRCLEPAAAFVNLPLAGDFDPTTQNATVTFINSSSNYDVLSWDFGDGSPLSTAENPTHAFSCPGDKSVTLTVTNTFCVPNQVDTITIPVTITDSQNAFTTGVTVGDASLLADRDLVGTTYQWLDCDNGNTPIPNAINQAFTPILPNGNYAVQLTTNGCVSVSDCYSLISLSTPIFNKNLARLVPNPTKGKLELIDNSVQVSNVYVYNVLGMQVGNTLDLSAHQAGIYLVKVFTDKGVFKQKVVKE